MCGGTIRKNLRLREGRMLGRGCWELEKKMQGKGIWKSTKRKIERFKGAFIKEID